MAVKLKWPTTPVESVEELLRRVLSKKPGRWLAVRPEDPRFADLVMKLGGLLRLFDEICGRLDTAPYINDKPDECVGDFDYTVPDREEPRTETIIVRLEPGQAVLLRRLAEGEEPPWAPEDEEDWPSIPEDEEPLEDIYMGPEIRGEKTSVRGLYVVKRERWRDHVRLEYGRARFSEPDTWREHSDLVTIYTVPRIRRINVPPGVRGAVEAARLWFPDGEVLFAAELHCEDYEISRGCEYRVLVNRLVAEARMTKYIVVGEEDEYEEFDADPVIKAARHTPQTTVIAVFYPEDPWDPRRPFDKALAVIAIPPSLHLLEEAEEW